MVRMKHWTVGLVVCFLLLVASKASAAYVVIENISDEVSTWGSCNCHPGTGWVTTLTLRFLVQESDGTSYRLHLGPNTYTKKSDVPDGNFFWLDISKENPLAPGASLTTKRIVGLPDSGFTFISNDGAGLAVYYCQEAIDACVGYFTGMTGAPNSLPIRPGMLGSDTIEFQVLLADYSPASVVRITFYPDNPPGRGKGK